MEQWAGKLKVMAPEINGVMHTWKRGNEWEEYALWHSMILMPTTLILWNTPGSLSSVASIGHTSYESSSNVFTGTPGQQAFTPGLL
ncbi:Uncharacterised protein [Cedecea neteri]|uniref:Uncharacterized protein n=1 Tax=Cedecea neteri TaxID=158822 RepID=A0A2X3KZZ6_9ENTR|nr:Uncharacterised protein [Cedecea neteri]